MTIGELTSFIYLFTLLVFPLRLIGFALSELPYSIAGWNRIRELLDQPVQSDPALTLRRHADNSIELDGVSYNHDGTRDVLHSVSSRDPRWPHGRCGRPDGRRKDDLPAADRRTDPGRLRLDHRPPTGLCSGVPGAVPARGIGARQRGDGSCRRPTRRSGPRCAAAEASFVHEFTEGLDTIVGERGVGLSGGQRQRVALARALIGGPVALLLDDTTSSLDPGTEARVLANLRETLRNTTVVAVASRPSTIALADDVLYLSDGQVVAHGRHEQLLVTVPEYRRLMEAFEHDRAEQTVEVVP